MSKVLVISGSMGAGKTTLLGEASDLLLGRNILHAAIDLDMVSLPLLPELQSHEVHVRNMSAIFSNCREAGIDRFLIAAAIENREGLAEIRNAFQANELLVCRLTASQQTMTDRLRTREPGIRQEEFVARARELDARLIAAGVEDFAIANDGDTITAVATAVLQHAHWI